MIGIAHTVRPADIDETVGVGESALDAVARLARTKARVIAELEREAVIIGSDTIVVIDGAILNKPVDADDARRMLKALRGRTHVVHTAVAVVTPGAEVVGVETVAVTFRGMTDGEVDAYIATGEPMDKAGAYGIQGYGATIVERIEGDFFAVMGLPLVRLTKLLGEVGVNYAFGGVTA
jgi:septum formation protein